MYLTTAEAAKRLGVTSGVVTQMAKAGVIPCKIVSKRNAIRQRRKYLAGDVNAFKKVYRPKHHWNRYKPGAAKPVKVNGHAVEVKAAPATGILTQIKHLESRITKLESRLTHIDETVTKLLQIWS